MLKITKKAYPEGIFSYSYISQRVNYNKRFILIASRSVHIMNSALAKGIALGVAFCFIFYTQRQLIFGYRGNGAREGQSYTVQAKNSMFSNQVPYKAVGQGSDLNKVEWLELVKKHVKFPVHSAYGSHVVPLLAAALVTEGPIFEMGSGFFSTPMLSEIAQSKNRFILTADTDKEWLDKFKKYEGDQHKFVYVPYTEGKGKGSEWEDVGNGTDWSLVFLDHRPGWRRGVDLRKYRKQVDLIVAHDTEERIRKGYHYDNELETFAGHYTVKKYGAWTSIVSDTKPELVSKVKRLVEWASNFVHEQQKMSKNNQDSN